MNLNLGIGALDIPIARKLDISGAPERPLQAPGWPAQAPGKPAQVPGLCLAQTRLDRAGPSRLRSGPSERCISPSWTGGTMERPASGWSGGIRMERWESAMGRWHDFGPRQPRRPVRLPIRPSGPGQWRGAADAQLTPYCSGPKTRNTRLHTNSSHA